MSDQRGKNLRNAPVPDIAIECETKPISGVQNWNACRSDVGKNPGRGNWHASCNSVTANLIILFQWCIMTSSSLPLDSSADLKAACPCECQIPADPRSLAIQSLEANPNFHGRLALAAIQIESDGDTLVLNGRVPSYYLKQLLQETVRQVDGVANVENHVMVVNPSGLHLEG